MRCSSVIGIWSLLLLMASLVSLAKEPVPEAMDSSVVVTTTADFRFGNDEGMISFGTDSIGRAGASGGAVGPWTGTTGFNLERYGHSSVVYNGRIYLMGGYEGHYLNDVQYSAINADGTLGEWLPARYFSGPRSGHASVAYNGYIYIIAGLYTTGSKNDVLFAPVDQDGSLGAWTATTALPFSMYDASAAASNGYLYVLWSGNLFFAPINLDGSLGAWTSTSAPPCGMTLTASAGFLYAIGGCPSDDVHYAVINPDGTLGTWADTTGLPVHRGAHTTVDWNGYLYVIGGINAVGYSLLGDVLSAPINSDGSLGAWTETTGLSAPRYRHTSVVYDGRVYVIGGYDNTNYFRDAQFATIALAAAPAQSWTRIGDLPAPRKCPSSLAYNGYLYVVGGSDGTNFLNDVRYAPIHSDGTTGAWTATSSFTTARVGHRTAAYNGFMYLVGGLGLDDVQFAPINPDGSLGAWGSTTVLPFGGRTWHSLTAYNGYMYVAGGLGSGFNETILVQYAPINADGTVGTWNVTTLLPAGRSSHASVARDGYLYLIGGASGGTLKSDVLRAPILPDGSLGNWTTTTSFSGARVDHACDIIRDRLYLAGGYNAPNRLDDTQSAPFNPDGSLGAWTAGTALPIALSTHSLVGYGGYLYIVGGETGATSSFASIFNYSSKIDPEGCTRDWVSAGSYPSPRHLHESVVSNGRLYILGGTDGTYKNDVQMATLRADGTPGPWSATTGFTRARVHFAAAVYGCFMYVMGGDGYGYLNDVQYAPINQDGTLGSWVATESFSSPRYAHAAVAYKGYLYILGGVSGGGDLNDVQYAPIHQDGTVGAWDTATSFEGPRQGHTAVAFNGRLYVIGGNGRSDVQFAEVQADGSLGPWSYTRSLQAPRWLHTSVAYGGYIYVMGGGSVGLFNDVQYAPINPDGTLGQWFPAFSFTTPRHTHASVAWNGHIYVIGGWNGGLTPTVIGDVQVASLQGVPTRGAYSKQIDLGSQQLVKSIRHSAATGNPWGTVNLSYAVAGDSGSPSNYFSPDMAPQSDRVINRCGRYLWARFEFDDALATLPSAGGTLEGSGLLDFTVTYGPVPTTTGDTLGAVKWTKVHLAWNPVGGMYNVMRCDSSAGSCTPVFLASTYQNTYDDDVLGDASSYWYSVVPACPP